MHARRCRFTVRGMLVLVLAAMAAASPAGWGADAVEKPDLTIGVGGAASDLDKLAYGVALAKGYFRDEGLNIKNVDMFSGAKALQALASGNIDAVEGAYEGTLRMQAQGVTFTCTTVFARFPGIVMMVLEGHDDIRSPADLKGRKIGVTGPGSATHTLAAAAMRRAGLDPKDASFIGVGVGASAVAAAKSGQIDVLVNIDPTITILQREGAGRILLDSRTLEGTKAAYGGIYPAGCIFVPAEFIAKYPKTAQALSNAMVRSMKFLQEATIDDVVKSVPKNYYQDAAVYHDAVAANRGLWQWDGIVDPSMSKNVLDAITLLNPKLSETKIDFAKTYDNDLTRRALAKFK